MSSRARPSELVPAGEVGYDDERRQLGQRVRELRRGQALSTRILAERSGLSASMINQIETGKAGASIETLRRIAGALGVPLAELFLDERAGIRSTEDPAVPRLATVVRRDRRKRLQIPESRFVLELLTPDLRGNIEFVWIELDPFHPPTELMSHAGEECAIVLQGTLHIIIQDQEFVLGPGDSIRFDSSLPHRVENRGREKAIEISAITPPSF